MNTIMATYSPLDFEPSSGIGAHLVGRDGHAYLDLISGVGVNGLGHGHPKLVPALQAQVARLMHCSNLYRIGEQHELAARLSELSGASGVFFCNSGCEANEAAIKLARLHGHNRGIATPKIIVMDGAFHGRTLATVAATASPKVRAGFAPLPEGFVRVPYNDIPALEALDDTECVAVLVEPVQGEGGVNLPDTGYLTALREVCSRKGWLLMLDEVQTGIGRTGRWFAHQHSPIRPDVMTIAKGLGSGVPIGACLAWGDAAHTFTPGSHGSTFGGNPLACRAGLETLAIIDADGLLEHALELGAFIVQQLRDKLADLPQVVQIRGLGLMIGITLDRPCQPLVAEALREGLLINVTAERVVRLLPPLVLSREEASAGIATLTHLIRNRIQDSGGDSRAAASIGMPANDGR
ncbi:MULTISPECIES: aspartate aminotransferase family protein [Pseudomonas]|uniref:Acetylornithine aminotransferase n=1 Tax=Pseudomonas fluorescens TaxID=294 RepID=A0A125QF97_PSEFL|nr:MULTISPECIES: aspartate aminotransferase family protein [Pseudomonas]KWV77503.1 Acetylornithine aminotransferase [Pseudomonas fluorescens]